MFNDDFLVNVSHIAYNNDEWRVTEPVSVGYALSTEILYQMLMISFQGVLMF